MSNNPKNIEIAENIQQSLVDGRHPLRQHQLEAVQCSVNHIKSTLGDLINLPEGQTHDDGDLKPIKTDNPFLVVSATGTGKTRILGALMDGSDVRSLILTPRTLLGKQAFKEFCKEMDIPEDKVGIIDGTVTGRKRREALAKPYLISTYQSLPALTQEVVDADAPSGNRFEFSPEVGERPLILLDEAHTAQGVLTARILNDLKKTSLIGGVTATDAGASNTLFGGQAPIFNLNLIKAVKQGLLCTGIRPGVIDVKIDEDWVQNFIKSPRGQDFRAEDVEKFAKTPSVIKGMVDFHLAYEDSQLGKIDRLPTLVFTQGVTAAKDGVKKFNELAEAAGSTARADYVSGVEEEQGHNKEALKKFERGEIKVLFNDRMLEMGYDLPEASVVYSLKPTQYRHTAEQQLGRVTRREPADYFEKYGMDKVALAINVRPKGTTPYTYAEVIGNEPSLYAKNVSFENQVEKLVTFVMKRLTPTEQADFIKSCNAVHGTNLSPYSVDKTPLEAAIYAQCPARTLEQLGEFFEPIRYRLQASNPLTKFRILKEPGKNAPGIGGTPIQKPDLGDDIDILITHEEMKGLISNNEVKKTLDQKPCGWLSINEMLNLYVGGRLMERMLNYAQDKVEVLVSYGIAREAAKKQVEQTLIGPRDIGNGIALCVSTEAIKELRANGKLRLRDEKAKIKEDDWRTAEELSQQFVGGDTTIRTKLGAFCEHKRAELLDAGIEADEAARTVDNDWCGLRTSGRFETLCASPLAVEQLKRENILVSRAHQAPPRQEGWLSVGELTGIYYGGRLSIQNAILAYREQIKSDLLKQGITVDEANMLIETEYLGIRMNGRREGLCVAPTVVAELESSGKLRKPPPLKGDWLSNNELASSFQGDNNKFKDLLLQAAETLRQDLIENGVPEAEAARQVADTSIGMRATGKGEAICVSPIIVKQLESQGILVRRSTIKNNFIETYAQGPRGRISSDSIAGEKNNGGGWTR